MRAVDSTLGRDNSFTAEAVDYAINTTMARLRAGAMEAWVAGRLPSESTDVAVLNAGNIPLVGLQDFLAVVLTGHRYHGVVSSKSPALLPAFADTLKELVPALMIRFTDVKTALNNSRALIATGADATTATIAAEAERCGIDRDRQLLRGTRYSVAVVDGGESTEDLDGIAADALVHEGRGCLNVSIIFAPRGLDTAPQMRAFRRIRTRFPAHPSTVRLLRHEERLFKATCRPYESIPGVLLLRGEPNPGRPGVVVWSEYEGLSEVEDWIERNEKRLQVVIKRYELDLRRSVVEAWLPGTSQNPPIDWKPDRKDTVEFLNFQQQTT